MNSGHPLSPHQVLDSILEKRFGTEYQPIIATRSGEVFGWEALARFYTRQGHPLPPQHVFELLHDNPLLLYHTEYSVKCLQIAHAPSAGKLFINLDPDSYHHGKQADGSNLFRDLFKGQQDTLVVELIENLHIKDVEMSREVVNALAYAEIPLALDDLSTTQGLVSLENLSNARFLKFDRSWLGDMRKPRRKELLEWVLDVARRLNAQTILEGVERPEDLQLAEALGVDFVQGFLFREKFILINHQTTL